jgi:copper homeostasis protein (lipoprotein)
MTRVSLVLCAALVAAASAASAQTVTGSVTYRERVPLPSTAVLEVMLVDASRVDAPALAIASARLEMPGDPPIAFVLDYDPRAIHPGRRYALRARIQDRDRLMFTTTESYPVLTQGHGRAVDIVVRQVGPPAPPPSNPAVTPGAVPAGLPALPVARPAPGASAPVTLAGLPASFIGTVPCEGCPGTRVHLNLFPDDSFFLKTSDQGRANVRDDLGSWALSSDGRVLALQGRGGQTRFALADAQSLRPLDADGNSIGALGAALRKAARFQPLEVRLEMQGAYRKAGDLSLFTECSTGRTWTVAADDAATIADADYLQDRLIRGESILLSLEGRVAEAPRGSGPDPVLHVDRQITTAAGASCVPRFVGAPLERTSWRLVQLGATAAPPTPASGTQPYVIFDDDTSRFSGAGGCNRLVGAYDVDGGGIALEVAGTMTACPASEGENAFTTALRRASSYRIVGRELSLFDDQGTLLARFEGEGVR